MKAVLCVLGFGLIGLTSVFAESSVKGTVKFVGSAPEMPDIRFAEIACSRQHTEPVKREDIIVNPNATLKNVIVYVKEGLPAGKTYPPPAEPVKLNQQACMYVPHVFGIQANQPLQILNSDPTIHNINAQAKINPKFNASMLNNKVPPLTKKFPKAELPVRIKCDVHPWMQAFAGVFEHPFFAVTGEDGSFEIKGLPAGTYTIASWHEKYPAQEQKVTVTDGTPANVEFSYNDPVQRVRERPAGP